VFDFLTLYLYVTYVTGMPQLKIVHATLSSSFRKYCLIRWICSIYFQFK